MNEIRSAHNYLFKVKENDYAPTDLELLNNYKKEQDLPEYKIALLLVSVNSNYWPYAAQVYEDVQKNFLPGHKVDTFLWSDMPKITKEQVEKKEKDLHVIEEANKTVTLEKRGDLIFTALKEYVEVQYLWTQTDQQKVGIAANKLGLGAEFQPIDNNNANLILKNINENTVQLILGETRKELAKYKNLQEQSNLLEVEPIEWPYGTLMRYSMFLQEESLKDYDYVFYLDVDMRIVNIVGDEILGPGLTMAEHPMYALRKDYVPPYEPNEESTAYIPRFGKIVQEDGRPRLKPLYAAGGFQGGRAGQFLEAMKVMRDKINQDFNKNYTAIWNDESHWNRYLFDFKGDLVVLSPSYIYPDSLIKEYYEKLWGRSYPPKIITLTKPFTLQKIDPNRFISM